jgi:hypothetical protein
MAPPQDPAQPLNSHHSLPARTSDAPPNASELSRIQQHAIAPAHPVFDPALDALGYFDFYYIVRFAASSDLIGSVSARYRLQATVPYF